ncbi:MAG: divalent-cation tolerance protein CutA [Fibrobacterota bacterium]|nr:divalent-cation tolerance protein CutA [Fibrobacterota bacterium]QQS07451.1 MAG: divalent-cation tolerance protein CutA [Fibrobacterota bacterium]
MTDFRLVYIPVPDEACGREIGKRLVERGLAACANILPRMTSIYRWEGKLEEDREALLLAKTHAENLTELQTVVKELHPYRLPCVVALTIDGGLPAYLDWLKDNTRVRH